MLMCVFCTGLFCKIIQPSPSTNQPSQSCSEEALAKWQLVLFCKHYCALFCLYSSDSSVWLISNPLSSLCVSFTVRQRGRELRQVLHAYPAPAYTARRAGYSQHWPGRVFRVLFHQPPVCTSVSYQQYIKRMLVFVMNLPAHCRLPKPTIDKSD